MDGSILDPRSTYASASDWEAKAKPLAQLFVDNFERFTDTGEGAALVAAGPQL